MVIIAAIFSVTYLVGFKAPIEDSYYYYIGDTHAQLLRRILAK
jgi:hypothetical protein